MSDNPRDNKMLLMKCIGNTCKIINVGKCPDAQPIQNPDLEMPINYGKSELPDLSWSGWSTMSMLDDGE